MYCPYGFSLLRLDGFFQGVTPSFLRDKSSDGSTESPTSSAGSSKRLRTSQSGDGPITAFAPVRDRFLLVMESALLVERPVGWF